MILLFIGLLQVKALTHVLPQATYGPWVQINTGLPLLVLSAGLNLSHSLRRLGSGAAGDLKQRYLATNLTFSLGFLR